MLPRPSPSCTVHHGGLRAASQWPSPAARARACALAGTHHPRSRFLHSDERHRYQQHLQRQRDHQRDQQQPKSPLLNPPASTRPPPLDVPERRPDQAAPAYYFNLGKAYIRFYKDGLKSIFRNRRLLRERLAALPAADRPSILRPHAVPRTFSRADWVLLWRVRHDMLRLPFFAVMLTVIGELTALVVVFVDGVVPYPCRIPRQIASARDKAERRRRLAFFEFEARHPHGPLSPGVTRSVARGHVLRTLDLSGRVWDKVGFAPPGLWSVKGRLRMAFLEGDDRRLMDDGGPLGLEAEELRIACAERGIDVLGRNETELRSWLSDWLRLTAAEDLGERRRRMATLLLTRPENWPQKRDFAVPDWELS